MKTNTLLRVLLCTIAGILAGCFFATTKEHLLLGALTGAICGLIYPWIFKKISAGWEKFIEDFERME